MPIHTFPLPMRQAPCANKRMKRIILAVSSQIYTILSNQAMIGTSDMSQMCPFALMGSMY